MKYWAASPQTACIPRVRPWYNVGTLPKENERELSFLVKGEGNKLEPAFRENENKVIRSLSHLNSNYYFQNI